MFLKFCGPCQTKVSFKRIDLKDLIVRSITDSKMNIRVQVDLIDMQSQADGEFFFFLWFTKTI